LGAWRVDGLTGPRLDVDSWLSNIFETIPDIPLLNVNAPDDTRRTKHTANTIDCPV
jgi:hypothetical protein